MQDKHQSGMSRIESLTAPYDGHVYFSKLFYSMWYIREYKKQDENFRRF